MKVATWNVNSVRSRQDQVVDWLRDTQVDVLCLQETKVVDEKFPRSPFEALGYHLYIWGQKSYNGVAILSKPPAQDVSVGFTPILSAEQVGDFDEQKRVIAAVIEGVRIVNLYVPNGAAVDSEKYHYKLRWLEVLRDYLQALRQKQPEALCVCGDINIAPEDRDIYDPTNKEKHIMSSPAERKALQEVLSLGLADAFRKFTAESGHYSWWDYRTRSFRGNRGWRIDHLYLTPNLYERTTQCTIDRAPRQLAKPSDHAPVIVEFSSEHSDD